MPTHVAKSRKKLKEKEAKEDKAILVEEKDEDTKSSSNKQGGADDDGGIDSAPVADKKVAQKAGSKQRRSKADVGGFIKPSNGDDKDLSDRRSKQKEKGKEKIILLNDWANNILSCLDPEAKQNFLTAAFDAKVKDIGVYILGVLNRMHKMADYFEPDIETDWEDGLVGYDQDLYCGYCGKEIKEPTHLRQIFCDNKCARNHKLQNTTGVLFPKTVQDSAVDPEEKQWEHEQKRMGAST
jgi:hypothetical protein